MPATQPGSEYNHARLERRRGFLRFLIKYIGFGLLAKVDRVEGIEQVPDRGPAILMINHIAFIDPIVVLHLLPRNIVPMAKIEVYNYPGVGIFPRLWEVIPVRRQEIDRNAIRQALEILAAGEIILVAPEGTRSNQLQQAKEGVVYLAIRSHAPIIPVAIDGTIGFPTLRGSARWRKPGAVVRFGPPIYIKDKYQNPSREEIRKMTDEVMYMLAALLPKHRRGYYKDLSKATRDTIQVN
jgi:1-acyl-sn-glycerol-3-phosphate acyltransferase